MFNLTQWEHIQAQNTAERLYTRVTIVGQFARIWGMLRGKNNQRLEFAAIPEDVYTTVATTRASAVPISRIRGTAQPGQQQQFDAAFRPTTSDIRKRWLRVAMAYERAIDLPPVELVEIDGEYFVRDGHLRVSAARAMGRTYVEANVTSYRADAVRPKTRIACAKRALNLGKA
jgi:glucose/arabinose dehydrogenase